MRRLLLFPLLLGGCLPRFAGVPASPDALPCAERAAAGLGYHVTARSDHSFTAEKEVPGFDRYRAVGVVSATLWPEPGRRYRLRVSGARYEERRMVVRPGTVGAGWPPGGVPGGVPVTPVEARGRSRRRLPPGPVAEDAAAIQQQCGGGVAVGPDAPGAPLRGTGGEA